MSNPWQIIYWKSLSSPSCDNKKSAVLNLVNGADLTSIFQVAKSLAGGSSTRRPWPPHVEFGSTETILFAARPCMGLAHASQTEHDYRSFTAITMPIHGNQEKNYNTLQFLLKFADFTKQEK
jgi:hypothetical protein